jgi:hypothetical protein
MMPTTTSKNIIVALSQLHPLPSNLNSLSIFDFQLEHVFVLDKIMFTQALANAPHLSSGGLSGMVYEHLSGCFMPKDPSS